jgi:CRP/FNR family cyclic AMP-dependent transcriptional regulator
MAHAGSPRPLPLFDPLLRHARLRLIPAATSRSVSAGQVLTRQGETSQALHLVETGAVSVSSVSPAGRRAILACLHAGEVFGQEALLPGSPSGAQRLSPEIRAVVPSRILSVPLSYLFPALSSQPELAWWLAVSLAGCVELLQRRLARTLTQTVRERVLGALQDLGGASEQPIGCDTRIEVPVTQEALASMVGATRESVNRAVRALVAEGRVRRTGRFYRLVAQSAGPGCS